MPTTFAQRQAEAAKLMAGGFGVVAIAVEERDEVLVKDPSYLVPSSSTIEVWHVYAGGQANAAYFP